jgi:glycosyltransferase involved in cell wall biosynthesis
MGFEKNQIFFCPNPIDTEKFPLKKPNDRLFLKKHFCIDEKDRIFIFVGRFDPQKNIGKIIKTIRKIRENEKNVKLLMIGSVTFSKSKLFTENFKKNQRISFG